VSTKTGRGALLARPSRSTQSAARRLVACVGLALASGVLGGCGGASGGISASAGRQAYAHELRPNPVTHVIYGIDPDQEPESSADDTSVLRSLPDHRFQLLVTNTSDTGSINEFSWLPPGGMEVVRVLGSSTGQCTLSSQGNWDPLAPAGPNSIVNSAAREIICKVTLPPPKCSCQSGATVRVNFVANYKATDSRAAVVSTRLGPHGHFVSQASSTVHFGSVNSWVEIDSMTPAPYKIPSYVGGESNQEDLPLCSRGQLTTSTTPCSRATRSG
jgi:hypothetical protein